VEHRGTSFLRYQYSRADGTTVVSQYHKYWGITVRYVPTNSRFIEDFRAKKKQFIDSVNKLDVFKLYVDDILVQLVTDALALRCVNSSCKRE